MTMGIIKVSSILISKENNMRKIKVTPGVYWIEIPDADIYILCGCPADSVKHLMKKGLISRDENIEVFTESGPNVILLSDISMQKESLCNLAEFPVLQMLYRQGMILPNHSNNSGVKPILVGTRSELDAQVEYIYRGNYGLTTVEEIMSAGIDKEQAAEMMRMKLKFAFGKLKSTLDLIDTIEIESDSIEIRNNVYIERISLNRFLISYMGEHVEVDLNLDENEDYEPPYKLGYHQTKREYFSVVHTGEGNGWDITRPCMSSILTFQGKIYLVDAGPNILSTLKSLGIGVNEIEGIFHTHAHDDHFCGLAELMRSDHRIKYFSTQLVRHSVIKKLAALTSLENESFYRFFEFHDLDVDKWNNIDGLEIKPLFSPHPLETNIFFFRTLWGDGYKTYAHLADIASFNVLENMISDDNSSYGITSAYFDVVKKNYLESVQIKKIDAGGGLIHGSALDFELDNSDTVLISHIDQKLTNKQKEIGEHSSFGAINSLIPTEQDYSKRFAYKYLLEYFPSVPLYEINMILNCPIDSYNPGSIIIRKGKKSENIFLVLSGIVEFVNVKMNTSNILTVGSFIGELSELSGSNIGGTYRATSFVKVLRIPTNMYVEFLKRNDLLEELGDSVSKRYFLQNSLLFGERVSSPQRHTIAKEMICKSFKKDSCVTSEHFAGVRLIISGEIEVRLEDHTIEILKEGDFYSEGISDHVKDYDFIYFVKEDTTLYEISEQLVDDIPVVQWKLLEAYKRRKGIADM